VRATLIAVLLALASTAAAKPAASQAHVAGTIRKAGTTPAIPKGAAIFVIVMAADADGNPTGIPLAVKKLSWSPRGLTFRLTAKDQMLETAQLAGKVIVIARFDQDGDPITKQPGDVEGRAPASVSADGVKVVLDQVVP
jgi:cytochrome c5